MTVLLEVENLRVSFPTATGRIEVVKGLSFLLGRERLGIVGESGSGKSMTGRAILRLVRQPGRQGADRMIFDGIDLMAQSERGMRRLRGARISMIMQDPKFSLNPVMTVGAQIAEALVTHERLPRRDVRARVIEMLHAVRLPGAARRTREAALRVIDSEFAASAPLPPDIAQDAISTFAREGIGGGGVYDGLVGLAAKAAGVTLLSCDRRALATYAALGVDVRLI